MSEFTRVGKRGAIVLPAKMRKRDGFEGGTMVVVEESEYGVLLRPAVVIPVEVYSQERKAELLMANAVGPADRKKAEAEVRKLGLDPRKLGGRKASKR
jgi:AbrB family looped-hinge helix DNA binding protein